MEARFVLSYCRGDLNSLESCPKEDTHHLGKTRSVDVRWAPHELHSW